MPLKSGPAQSTGPPQSISEPAQRPATAKVQTKTYQVEWPLHSLFRILGKSQGQSGLDSMHKGSVGRPCIHVVCLI